MRVIWITAALLIAAVAAVALIGAWLPRKHVAALETHLPIAPQNLWTILIDIDGFPDWRPDVKRVDTHTVDNGLPGWTEHTSEGRIRFVVDRMDPPRSLVVRIADPDLPFGGTWTYEISPQGRGSSLRITERGEVYNPIFRFVARFVFGHDRTIRLYLNSLERRIAQEGQRHGV
jgi:hypothetical protein